MTSTAAAGGDDCCDDCCEDSPLCLQACGCIIALPSMMLGITAAALAGSEHEAASVIVPIGWVALGIELVSLAFLDFSCGAARARAGEASGGGGGGGGGTSATAQQQAVPGEADVHPARSSRLRLAGRLCTFVCFIITFHTLTWGIWEKGRRAIAPILGVAFLSYFAAFCLLMRDINECRKLFPRRAKKKATQSQSAVVPTDVVTAQPRPPLTFADKLQQLADAKGRGLLSDDEHEIAKQQMIAALAAADV